jgi:hypothetical protein
MPRKKSHSHSSEDQETIVSPKRTKTKASGDERASFTPVAAGRTKRTRKAPAGGTGSGRSGSKRRTGKSEQAATYGREVTAAPASIDIRKIGLADQNGHRALLKELQSFLAGPRFVQLPIGMLENDRHSEGLRGYHRFAFPSRREVLPMRPDVKSTAIAMGLDWGVLAMFLIGLANLMWSDYGRSFLEAMASVYPGYNATASFGQVIVGTVYGLADGAVVGAIFAWIYSRFVAAGPSTT